MERILYRMAVPVVSSKVPTPTCNTPALPQKPTTLTSLNNQPARDKPVLSRYLPSKHCNPAPVPVLSLSSRKNPSLSVSQGISSGTTRRAFSTTVMIR